MVKFFNLAISISAFVPKENSFLSATFFSFRDDGADKAFIDFIEASDLETAQKAFFQSCKAINMEPCGTIDTFYTSYREAIKVFKGTYINDAPFLESFLTPLPATPKCPILDYFAY